MRKRAIRGDAWQIASIAEGSANSRSFVGVVEIFCENGRGDWIRTSDPLRPRQVRYQAALRPDIWLGISRKLLQRESSTGRSCVMLKPMNLMPAALACSSRSP